MFVLNHALLHWKPLFWCLLLFILACVTIKGLILPLSGLYLFGYVIALITSSTWGSFVAVQNFLLQKNKVNLPKLLRINSQAKLEDFNELPIKELALNISEQFIEKWFIDISKDPIFSEESRVLLEEVLEKFIKVQRSLDYEVIAHGVFNLYLKHLKEFRRSLKRKEKYHGKISDLYRYSHACSTSRKTKNYFIHQLTVHLLNHFINWELSNSLPYQVLVAIISRKVILFLLNYVSDPQILNYYILVLCASTFKKVDLKLDEYNAIEIINITDKSDATYSEVVSTTEHQDNLQKESDIENEVFKKLDAPKIGTKFENPQLSEFQNEEVKVYEPKSCKTWCSNFDFGQITIGQDTLDSLELGESGKDTVDGKDTEQDRDVLSPILSAKSLLDDVKNITNFEGLKTSMKPLSEATATTINNIKDLQETTVNNVVKPVSQVTSTALHKIGGLHLQDEAAGMMEGILDFGRTRIRKGLRLTGLQDSPPEEGIKIPAKKHITKMDHVKSQEKMEETETTWMNPLQEEHIVKHEVTLIPSITQSNEDGSPEPEYEETADLATSIAKLRSLLEQKSSESSLSTPALSPMPSEELLSKIELEEGDETDGMMPSFYKFCAKTATGVIHNTLNTIKTALPGNMSESDRCDGTEKWLFVESGANDCDLHVKMQKILCERKVFCTVDAAYEAIDSLGSLQDQRLSQSQIQFEDELDDFEVKLPVTKALLDIFCELMADIKDTSFTQEPVITSVMLLFGKYLEDTLIKNTKYYSHHCTTTAKIPTQQNAKTLSLELNDFVDIVLSGIPHSVKIFFGIETLREVVNLFVGSLQVEKINQDLFLQIFEIICMKLIDGSKQLTPMSG